MTFEDVSIAGLACLDAPQRISSAALCDRLGPSLARLHLNADVLEQLTGIVARRFWEPGATVGEVAALAGAKALSAAGLDRERVGVVISTSVSKDFIEPSVASAVHGRLGLSPRAMNFDVGNACLAFLDAMVIAGNMIERGQVEHALIVDGESSRFLTDQTLARLGDGGCDLRTFFANFASLTLGSGAVAMVLSRRDLAPDGHRFKGGVFLAASQHNGLCRGQAHEMLTDSAGLLTAGLVLAEQAWALAARELDWSPDALDEVCVHQVSARHTQLLGERLGLDPAKLFAIYPEFGNIGPASLPTLLAKADAAGRLAKGSRVGLLGIGSGLNCAMFEVEW